MLQLKLSIANLCEILDLSLHTHHIDILMTTSKVPLKLVIGVHFLGKFLLENFGSFSLVFQDPLIRLWNSHHSLLLCKSSELFQSWVVLRKNTFFLDQVSFITISLNGFVPHFIHTNLGATVFTLWFLWIHLFLLLDLLLGEVSVHGVFYFCLWSRAHILRLGFSLNDFQG